MNIVNLKELYEFPKGTVVSEVSSAQDGVVRLGQTCIKGEAPPEFAKDAKTGAQQVFLDPMGAKATFIPADGQYLLNQSLVGIPLTEENITTRYFMVWDLNAVNALIEKLQFGLCPPIVECGSCGHTQEAEGGYGQPRP